MLQILCNNTFMKNIYSLLVFILLLQSCSLEKTGGVLTLNELPESVILFIEEKNILDGEAIIAYYDKTITLNNSESAILTNKNVIYYKSGRINKIPLSTIKSISDVENCFGVCFLITSFDNQIMKIEIAPLNNGAIFLQLLINNI